MKGNMIENKMKKENKTMIRLDLAGIKDLTTNKLLDGYELIIPVQLWSYFLRRKINKKVSKNIN